MSLFRKEAVAHQSERLTGAIVLVQPMSIRLTVVVIVCVAIAIVAKGFQGRAIREQLDHQRIIAICEFKQHYDKPL